MTQFDIKKVKAMARVMGVDVTMSVLHCERGVKA